MNAITSIVNLMRNGDFIIHDKGHKHSDGTVSTATWIQAQSSVSSDGISTEGIDPDNYRGDDDRDSSHDDSDNHGPSRKMSSPPHKVARMTAHVVSRGERTPVNKSKRHNVSSVTPPKILVTAPRWQGDWRQRQEHDETEEKQRQCAIDAQIRLEAVRQYNARRAEIKMEKCAARSIVHEVIVRGVSRAQQRKIQEQNLLIAELRRMTVDIMNVLPTGDELRQIAYEATMSAFAHYEERTLSIV
jgi:hypothetical protein